MLKARTFGKVYLVTLVAGLVSFGAKTWAQTLNTLTPAETAAGWKLLFDGKSNAGWIKPDGSAGQFTPVDNSILAAGGDICTKDSYDNFELTVDYKYDADGNSGIFLRTKKGIDPPWLSGMEVAIQDNGRAGNLFKNGDAAVYDIKAASKDMWTGPGKWNTILVKLNGTKLEHWHNGEKVIDMDMSNQEWKTALAASKFSKSPFPENNWGKETKGQVCLQDHGAGHNIWFRNIKILPIAPGAKVPRGNPATGFHWEILGNGSNRILSLDIPGSREAGVSILDMSGKETLSMKTRGNRAMLPLGSLTSGIYWLRVTSPDFSFDRRFAAF